MARWLERLQEFDFTIEHRQGRKHTNADSLSRLHCRQCGRESHTNPVDFMYRELPTSRRNDTVPEHADMLKTRVKEAYNRVRV